jgi:uncharacterized protein YunC (DUF1805 family)
MIGYRKIKVGKRHVEAIRFPLGTKTLIAIRGRRGYVMCGYLNMKVARDFGEAAVKISGVATISDALRTKVVSVTPQAKKLGIYKNQLIKDVLKIIV